MLGGAGIQPARDTGVVSLRPLATREVQAPSLSLLSAWLGASGGTGKKSPPLKERKTEKPRKQLASWRWGGFPAGDYLWGHSDPCNACPFPPPPKGSL